MNSMGVGAEGRVATGSDDRRLATIVAIAELRHPHLVVVNIADDGTGFEPDLSGGRLLSDLLRAQGGSLPISISLRILLDAMSGLAALHRARADDSPLDFVHGELTPSNIVVGSDGVGRLVPLVETHWSPGSPSPEEAAAYSAPEKLLGDECTQRADVFSAGVLLWEAMMGRPLFHGIAVDDIVTMLVGRKVVRPQVAGGAAWGDELADVVMRALAVDPADRWEHLGIMGADIETIALGQVAKSSDVASLVTGRQVSRDSLSDDVTRPLASVMQSLTPFANSIPSLAASDGLHPRRAVSTVPVVSTTTEPGVLLTSMTARRRRIIVGGALSFSLLLLLVAAIRGLGQKRESTAGATVLAPAPLATTVEAPAPSPVPNQPTVAAEIQAPAPSTPVAPAARPLAAQEAKGAPANQDAKSATAVQDAKGARSPGKVSTPAGRAKPPKEDAFGLSHQVRPKAPKEDPFGL